MPLTLVRQFSTPLLVAGWLLCDVSALLAQNTVNLQGRVTGAGAGAGPNGTPLVAARVTLSNRETGLERSAITSAQGTYIIIGLPPGAYRVRVMLLGYQARERDIRLLVGQHASLDFELAQAAVALEAVEVTHQREPVFEVQRNDVSSPVVTTEILNLPLNTRNTVNLAAVVPGMKTFAPTAGRSLPASGSLPDLRFWNFYLDGAEWKSFFNGNLVGIPQTGSPLPQEAMREFRVHLNPYDAQYTRGASFVISAVTQRGTNEFHGSMFGYGQTNALKALDLSQRERRTANPTTFSIPDYTRAQFGFNLRGPIQRDKLFFAVSYEGQTIDDGINVVPGRPAINPGVWDGFAGTFKAPTKNHTAVVRVTAPRGAAHTLDATWATRYYNSETDFGSGTSFGVIGAHDAGIKAKYRIHSAQLRDTYTPTASFLNELSLNVLSWSHNESPLEPGVTLRYPSLQFGTAGFPLVLKETHIRLVNRATYALGDGRHLLTGGIELARVRTNSWQPTNRDGFFQFQLDTSSSPLLGRIGVGFFDPTSDEDARAITSGWSTGAYIQDQWQARRNLQLTVGLRYDAEINTLDNDFTVPWASDPQLQAIPLLKNFLNTGKRKNDLNNVGPRVAFSWDVFHNARTFLRGGAGIMYDRITTFMAFNEKRSAGWRTYEFANPGTTDPDSLRRIVASGGATPPPPDFNLLKTNMKTPENRQFSIGIGHQLTDVVALNVDYIHQEARHLYVQITPNWLDTQTGQRNVSNSYGTITLYDDGGRAKFDALIGTLTYDRPGLRLNTALTLGWYKSEFEGLGGYIDRSYLIMQPTAADERWRLVFSGIADLPFDLKLSTVSIFAAPRPYVATAGTDVNHDSNVADDFVGGLANRTIRPVAAWNNLYRTVDLRLAKSVPVGGDRRISVSAEAFNIFNWDNYSGFVGRANDSKYGQKSGAYAPRQGQLGLRYEF
jgi:outer membrane receptor protein involved in Fe transport